MKFAVVAIAVCKIVAAFVKSVAVVKLTSTSLVVAPIVILNLPLSVFSLDSAGALPPLSTAGVASLFQL